MLQERFRTIDCFFKDRPWRWQDKRCRQSVLVFHDTNRKGIVEDDLVLAVTGRFALVARLGLCWSSRPILQLMNLIYAFNKMRGFYVSLRSQNQPLFRQLIRLVIKLTAPTQYSRSFTMTPFVIPVWSEKNQILKSANFGFTSLKRSRVLLMPYAFSERPNKT